MSINLFTRILANARKLSRLKPKFKYEQASSSSLFSFSKKSKETYDSLGNFSEDGMVLCHMTNYLPKSGFIESCRTMFGGSRNSVHFSINHPVVSHMAGDWSGKKYAILIPYKSAKNIGNSFWGGNAVDFYSKGRVKIPKGAVIVRHNEKVPQGVYRISDASSVRTLKNLKGVKLVETSETSIHQTANTVIEKLGYKLEKNAGDMFLDDISVVDGVGFQKFKAFSRFLSEQGMRTSYHTYTPNSKIDLLIENMAYIGAGRTSWRVLDKCGREIINYKREYLKILDYIKNFSKETGYPCEYNIGKLKQLLRYSKTPQEALSKLNSELGIKPMSEFHPRLSPEVEYMQLRFLVGGDKYGQVTDKLVLDLINNPTLETVKATEYAPAGLGALTGKKLKQIPAEVLKYGRPDTSIADRLSFIA